jgi:23S rRNA (pseudouridine1915-N3)-methyltransferase
VRIHVLTVGERMPAWVADGWSEYIKRMPRDARVELHEIPPGKRLKNSPPERAVMEEGQRMLDAIRPDWHVIALDGRGSIWSTTELAGRFEQWKTMGCDIALLIGGPDGLAETCRQRAQCCWSLSNLTFPHPMVRVILAEQLYRAWSLVQHHPYHR